MKFKIIDREKTGFAKYCPTFARAYDVMAEKIRRRRLVKNLAKDLGSWDPDVRSDAAFALGEAVRDGVNISSAVGALGKALGDEDPDVRGNAAEALGYAVANGVDITDVIGALGNLLADEDSGVPSNAVWALVKAAEKGIDTSDAVDALGKALEDESPIVPEYAARVLGYAVANEKTREAAVKEMLEFMNSSWFMQEAEKNSDAFLYIVNALDEALRKVKEAEREVA